MKKILVRRVEPTWPKHCAACLEFPQETVKTSCVIITQMMPFIGFIPTGWRHVSIRYPVCDRHAYLGRLKAFVAQRNPFNISMLAVSTGWLFLNVLLYVSFLLEYGPGGDTKYVGYAILVPLALLLIYYWARREVPVRIDTVDERTMLITFSNDNYADLFHEANKSVYFEG